MQLAIEHRTRLEFASDVGYTIQELHLTPQDGFGQRVKRWEIRVNGKIQAHADAFGNLAHTLVVEGPHRSIEITATGEVETDLDLPPAADRLPLPVYLRETPLTHVESVLAAFAEQYGQAGIGLNLIQLQSLMHDLRVRIMYDPSSKAVSATEAFLTGYGGSQGQVHAFIACCRHLGVPARFVSGYLFSATRQMVANHAWADVWVDGGWLSFDVTHGQRANGIHVRLATGLDARDASPVNLVRHDAETISSFRIQAQSQQ